MQTGAKTGNIGCSFLHYIFSDQRLDSEGNRQKCRQTCRRRGSKILACFCFAYDLNEYSFDEHIETILSMHTCLQMLDITSISMSEICGLEHKVSLFTLSCAVILKFGMLKFPAQKACSLECQYLGVRRILRDRAQCKETVAT